MAKYKDATKKSIENTYKKYGLKPTIIIAEKMLENTDYKADPLFYSDVNGEICESVLEVMIRDYMKKHEYTDWYISTGLVIQDPDNPGYLTELDVTVFTPKRVYMFECKSYGGDKRVIHKGTIAVKNRKTDVFDQHLKHLNLLNKNIERCIVKRYENISPYRLALFSFSLGGIDDQREDKFKRKFPVLTYKNVLDIFDNYDDLPVQWNMNAVKRIIGVFEKHSEKLTKKHLAFVKSIHGNS